MFSRGKKDSEANGSGQASGRPAVPSIVSTDMKVIGDLVSDGEIQVDGEVQGDIRSRTLLIGEPACVTGEIVADVVQVFGTVNGQIKAQSISLAKTARVVGDIEHEDLSIEKGAFLEGHCKRISEGKAQNATPLGFASRGKDTEPDEKAAEELADDDPDKLANSG